MADNSKAEIPDTYIKEPGSAHAEALAFQRLDAAKTSSTVVDVKVLPEFKDKFGETAKIDIASQIYENLKETHPEIADALERRIQAASRLTEYFTPKYMKLTTYKPGASAIEAASKPLSEQQEAWKSAKRNSQLIIASITEDIEKKQEKESLTVSEAFFPILKSSIDKGLLDKDDEMIFGDVLSAVTAELEFRDRLASSDSAITIAANAVDLQKSYEKQLSFDKSTPDTSKT